MTEKALAYAQMAEDTARQITGSYQDWTSFLRTAARLYKYPYHEQLMIYAQRPDATACASFVLWNNTMRRYVRRGSKGIALVDTSTDIPRIHYVFDVADTGGRENSRRPFLWQMNETNTNAVHAMLERQYSLESASLPDLLDTIATQQATAYWQEHQQEMFDIVDGSYLAEYDEYNVGAAFRQAASVSAAYALMSRCGLEPDQQFGHEDFMSVFDFNTPQTVAALGSAVSEISENVLRQIERTIRSMERSQENERTDLHPERGLPDPESDAGQRAAPPGQVRQDAEEIPAGASSDPVEQPDPVREIAGSPAGDRQDDAGSLGTDDGRTDESGGPDRADEGREPNGMGGSDELPESPGGENPPERIDLQLTDEQPEENAGDDDAPAFSDAQPFDDGIGWENLGLAEEEPVQMSLFPSETEQIRQIDQASDLEPGSFALSDDELDHALRSGSGFAQGKMRIMAFFSHDPSRDDALKFLKEEFGHGGKSHTLLDGSHGFFDYSPAKLEISRNGYMQRATVKWPTAEKHIRAMVKADTYLTDGEKEEYRALQMLYAPVGGVPIPHPRCAFPDVDEMHENLVAFLTGYDQARENVPDDLLLYEHSGFVSAVGEDAEAVSNLLGYAAVTVQVEDDKVTKICTFPADRLDNALETLRLSRDIAISSPDEETGERSIRSIASVDREAERAIDVYEAEFGADGTRAFHGTEQPALRELAQAEIDEAIQEWNGSAESRRAVAAYMVEHGRERGAAEWLRHEYGDDLPAFPVTVPGAAGDVSWTKVQQRVLQMIREDRFFTAEERRPLLPAASEARLQSRETDTENKTPGGIVYGIGDEIDWNVGNNVHLHMRVERIEDDGVWCIFLEDRVTEPTKMNRAGLEGYLDNGTCVIEKKAGEPQREEPSPPELPSSGLAETVFELTPNGYQAVETRPAQTYQYNCAYHDIAYLDGQAYQVESIGIADVSFLPLEMENLYPVLRVESLERLETLLAQDERNNHLLADAPLEARIQAHEEWRKRHSEQSQVNTGKSKEKEDVIPDNFRILDTHLGEGGQKEKFWNNIKAITVLKQIEAENRHATPEEQHILSQYVGWGGLPNAFDDSTDAWASEYSELKNLLTEDEYTAARASTLNAHYTSPTVIKAMYDALRNMGFQSGNILEPALGVGNFFGMLPEDMRDSRLYGTELDSISGRIAQQLYPQAHIKVAGFETTDRRDFYDVAIGNVPFGNYKVLDKPYDKLGFNIHNYFFAKSLDQVRSGGIVAFVTSKYTLDAQSPEVRKYLAQRADLLGAIRLPNNAFTRNAGTEVTTDIIFLQKRDRPMEVEPDWVHLEETEDGIPLNAYFAAHPEMVLGKMVWDDGMHGYHSETACHPLEGAELSEQLTEAIQRISGQYEEVELPDLGEGESISNSIPADPNVKNFSYTVVDGHVYFRENSIMVRPDLNKTAEERIKGMVAIRDCVHQLMDAQLYDQSDSTIEALQADLNQLYDDFTRKYGLINSRGNSLAFSDDSSYYLLCSLEILDEEGNLERKADMFTKRTIRQQNQVEHVDTAVEALAVSIGERACVDLGFMAALMGGPEKMEQIIHDLQGIIFKDPASGPIDPDNPDSNTWYAGWQTSDEYLSGNVREKLREAKAAAEAHPEFTVNVKALEQVQPKDLEAADIDVRIGATWIDKKVYQDFMYELLDTPFVNRWRDIPYYTNRHAIAVNYSKYTAEWNITNKHAVSFMDVNANTTYGTSRLNAYDILESTLNLRDVRVFDVKIEDGKEKRVLNPTETTLAQQKQQAIKDAFRDWIWKDPDRRQQLVAQYNELFNAVRPREYNGQHIVFAGMNPEISLRDHQKNAIAHVMYGGNTLLAHEVGAGKTYTMAAAIMESKRLGLCQKAMIVVPNHLTEQWASEFLRLYPSANILVTTKKDFEKNNRKKFCSRIATGDYDAVIIGNSQFERLPISRERQEMLLQDQINEVLKGIDELKANKGENFSIKALERTRKGLEARLKKLQESPTRDDVVTFEQLGVDRLYVDEAHSFKNLFLYTKMYNIAGLSTTEAQKSSDMFLKCRYIDEITDGRGIVFATGTPVSNSMTELYTMQRYLQYYTLKQKSLSHFDCWASTFGETVTAIELAPEGTGYRARTRFARFFNLPELMDMFKLVADIKTADQLNLPTPTAHYETVVVEPSEQQKEIVKSLSERAARVHSGAVKPNEDNMLKITSDGRKLGLDQRLINPMLPDDPNSKVNTCINNLFRIWEEGKEQKTTQLVFCDLSTPKGPAFQPSQIAAKAAPEKINGFAPPQASEGKAEIPQDLERFSVYDDIRDKLIARGIPPDQIALIHNAKTDVQKKDLFAKVRTGQVRILIGSTAKMGAGTNVQDRLIASHDLDCPWRPGDLEQRAGRIVRQGNSNPDVHIYRYVTKDTFDAYLWQTIENKQKFISQIMTSKSPVRSCEDVDETVLSYAEIKALCAGDPRIKEKMDLDVQVTRLKLLRQDHQNKQYRLEDSIRSYFPQAIENGKSMLAGLQSDLALAAAHPLPEEGFVGMEIKGDPLIDKENAGAALIQACKDQTTPQRTEIGRYRGFKMYVEYDYMKKTFELTLQGAVSHTVELSTSVLGNLTRIENALGNILGRIAATQEKLATLEKQLTDAKEELKKPFLQEEEYQEKNARLTQLNIELDLDSKRQQPEAQQTDSREADPVVTKRKIETEAR